MNWLNILPLNESRLAVLFEIYAEGEDYVRSISRRLQMNPSLAFSILRKLHEAGFVIRKEKGKEVYYSLDKNRDYLLLKKLLEEYHLEKALSRSRELKVAFNLLTSNAELMKASGHIYLFGSYVIGDYKATSDIDMLFVNEDTPSVGKACREISSVAGKTVNPLPYTRKKFLHDLARKEPLLTSVVDNVRNRAVIK